MQKEILSLILYPVSSLNINKDNSYKIYDLLKNEFEDIQEEEVFSAIKTQIKFEDIEKSIGDVNPEEKVKFFGIAKEIVETIELSKKTLMRLANIGRFLEINSAKTDFEFDLYDVEDINQFEFKNALRKFSCVTAAISFIPFMPVAGFALITSIQVGLLSKIANIYNYRLNPQEFLKLVGSSIGTGIVCKITSVLTRLVVGFIPLAGWAANALIAYAGTYAIGILAKSYIKSNGELTKESIKNIWDKSYQEGKEDFMDFKEYFFKKKDEFLKEVEKYKKKVEQGEAQDDMPESTEETDDDED